MFTSKKKIGNSLDAIKSTNRLTRLLRSNASFQASVISLERTDQEGTYSEDQKDVRNAMFKAEHERARALMMMQQQRSFY